MSHSRQASWRHAQVLPGDIRQVFDRFFSQEEAAPAAQANPSWAPRVDIREEAGRFLILADIPGVDPATIDIQMDKNVLTIKGERPAAVADESGKLSRIERSYGTFHRRFALPEGVDAEGITATGKHGVLEIAIPRKAEPAPRRISINAAG
ncbi:HSP20 family protein [Luteibacter sp. Sphag1AF]|uniref:Hsp20/alpha crystallin family protein n=1 Tax=Luteibacter sp. Sphag1AF TaxID=2587031 RepID=UPI0016100B07|nr:Hsp20/alpha crystallin family protein [Luteibacter sp. Sphag1AF]MBB3226790.1 HSP20 family protein [Luteibacter sp. Sphag1AF]